MSLLIFIENKTVMGLRIMALIRRFFLGRQGSRLIECCDLYIKHNCISDWTVAKKFSDEPYIHINRGIQLIMYIIN